MPREDRVYLWGRQERPEPARRAELGLTAREPVIVEGEPAIGEARLTVDRPLAVHQAVVGDARQIDAVPRAEVMPEVETRIDLEEIKAPVRGASLEVHLEDAGQSEARCDLPPEALELRLARKAQIRAVAGQRRVSADLAADEPFQNFTGRRGKAVIAPDRGIIAR